MSKSLVHLPSGRTLGQVRAGGLFGWLGKRPEAGIVLRISDTRVHTFGVRAPIDIAVCDATGRVLAALTLPPGRISPRVSGAACVYEASAGGFAGVAPGDSLLCA